MAGTEAGTVTMAIIVVGGATAITLHTMDHIMDHIMELGATIPLGRLSAQRLDWRRFRLSRQLLHGGGDRLKPHRANPHAQKRPANTSAVGVLA